MDLSEAFEHLLENVDKNKYTKGTVASWKNRFNANKLSYEKMHELLLDNNYKCFKSDEVWLQPGSDKPFWGLAKWLNPKLNRINKLKKENYART